MFKLIIAILIFFALCACEESDYSYHERIYATPYQEQFEPNIYMEIDSPTYHSGPIYSGSKSVSRAQSAPTQSTRTYSAPRSNSYTFSASRRR